MRFPTMITIPLDDLVAALVVGPLAYGCHWFVYCEQCDKEYHIWPDKAGLVCTRCHEPLVAIVAYSAFCDQQ